jgi:ribonucleoside-diphosphate reductase beta chain
MEAQQARTPARRTEQADFQATRDPGVVAEDSEKPDLLDYWQLLLLWERQQWRLQDIDLTEDRRDWHDRIPEAERAERIYGFDAFFVGEQRVASELGPMMRACPDEAMRLFLCTQIADEARHVAFFDRFYREVGLSDGEDIGVRVDEASRQVNDSFVTLFDEMLRARVDRLSREPGDVEAFVEAITIYHLVIEGMLALTGEHYSILFNEGRGVLPGLIEGLNNITRDEHRHVAFGVRVLRDMVQRDPRHEETIRRTLTETAPVAGGVLEPPWYGEDGAAERFEQTFGYSVAEAQQFAVTALTRRLAVIGVSMTG